MSDREKPVEVATVTAQADGGGGGDLGGMEFDFGPGLRMEERIDAAEFDAITERWEFGKWMLSYVPEGGKKLPTGFLDGLAEVTGKSRPELKFRRQFAERYPSQEALATVVANHRSWTEIRNSLPAEPSVHYSSATDEWETPQDLFDELDAEFSFELDVCALAESAKCRRFFSPDDDGLAQDWAGTCWMNPPYGGAIEKWIEKAWLAACSGATVVCLVPARVDTGWWWDYCRAGEIRFLRGRLKFGDSETSAPFPSAVVVFGAGKARVRWWERG